MLKLEGAIQRIKRLECPTGDVEHRVAGILEDYEVVNKGQAVINRDTHFDREGVVGYSTIIPGDNIQSLVVLAKSGLEDYVAKVVDAYLN